MCIDYNNPAIQALIAVDNRIFEPELKIQPVIGRRKADIVFTVDIIAPNNST